MTKNDYYNNENWPVQNFDAALNRKSSPPDATFFGDTVRSSRWEIPLTYLWGQPSAAS